MHAHYVDYFWDGTFVFFVHGYRNMPLAGLRDEAEKEQEVPAG